MNSFDRAADCLNDCIESYGWILTKEGNGWTGSEERLLSEEKL